MENGGSGPADMTSTATNLISQVPQVNVQQPMANGSNVGGGQFTNNLINVAAPNNNGGGTAINFMKEHEQQQGPRFRMASQQMQQQQQQPLLYAADTVAPMMAQQQQQQQQGNFNVNMASANGLKWPPTTETLVPGRLSHRSSTTNGSGSHLGEQNWLESACEDGGPGLCAHLITLCSILLVLVTIPFSLCFAIKVVQEYERAVIFRLGRLLSGGARGPGIFFIVPCVDSYQKVDMRTLTFDVPPQEILTKDSVTVNVDAIMYYKVSNAICAISNVDDYSQSTRLLAATTLRNVLGTKNLGDILSERESIANMMQSTLDEATDPWGVKVERVEVKDVRLPQQLQRAMAAEAEAAREARAKVIAAEGEHKASRSLRLAADIITESPAALQLRYLQTLNNISAEKNSTIVFPVPIDLISRLFNR